MGKYLLLIASLAVNVTVVSAWRACGLFLWNNFNSQTLKCKLILMLHEYDFSFLLVVMLFFLGAAVAFFVLLTFVLWSQLVLWCV